MVSDERTTGGSDGLPIGRGDLIQTRRNGAILGVANRQTWLMQDVSSDGSLWACDAASERKHQRTVHLPAEYVTEHAHLAYAATAYGVQGITAPESHTVLSDAGVYVGLTRGRDANCLHVVATDLADAREQFVAALEQDRADRGLREATERARAAVAGIVADGPVREVNIERARLIERIEDAEKRAAWWSNAAFRPDQQADEHRVAHDEQQSKLANAQADAEAIQASVLGPLRAQATEDAAALLAAHDRAHQAEATLRVSGRLRRRSATRTQRASWQEFRAAEAGVRERWGSVPATTERAPAWAQEIANRKAEDDPRLVEATQQEAKEQRKTSELARKQMGERLQLRQAIYRDSRSRVSAKSHAEHYAQRAQKDRQALAQIETLPPEQAAALIRERSEAERLAAAARAERAARLRAPEHDAHQPSAQRPDHDRELGL
ncbi:MAG: hypothetical protein QM602_03660 [Microbacterium sp.]